MEDRSFYVYAHYRLDTMEPFYIGKGKDGRKDVLSRNPIHDSISKKHGHAVVTLYDNLTEEEAFFYEREVIEDLVFNEGYEIPCKNCGEFTNEFSYLTNFSVGGEGCSGLVHSEKTKQKLSEINTGENHPMYGKHLSKETRKKIGECNKGKIITEETRKKISEGNKGKVRSEEVREKISKSTKGKYFSEETRKKISEGNKGKKKSEETRKKMSISKKGIILSEETKRRISKNKRNSNIENYNNIYCPELNIIFDYAKIAEEYCKEKLGIKVYCLNRVCNGVRDTCGNYKGKKLHWKWAFEIDSEIFNYSYMFS